MPPSRIVFAGAPGGGKTAVLQALALRGFPVAADSARSIIRARRARSLAPRPAPLEFAEATLRQDIEQYDEHACRSGLVFFERGVVDAMGMLHELGALPKDRMQALLAAHPYHPRVFMFPAWKAIYANDAERDQTFADAERVHRSSAHWYRRCGYDVVEVPKVDIEQRCAHVLQALGAAA